MNAFIITMVADRNGKRVLNSTALICDIQLEKQKSTLYMQNGVIKRPRKRSMSAETVPNRNINAKHHPMSKAHGRSDLLNETRKR